MSQRAFLQAFDGMAVAAFMDAGMADKAHYYAPGAIQSAACDVLVDRGVRDYGDDLAPVSTAYVRISFQLSQIQPVRTGRVVLLDDAGNEDEAFALDARIDGISDESMERWVVMPHV